MTKAEEALYHILCARWKITNTELTAEESKRLYDQACDLATAILLGNRQLGAIDTTGMVVQ